jgi:hypothetical protein
MLDCYMYAPFSIVMYVLYFLYAAFWRLPGGGGRQYRQKNFLCSLVMFISSPMYIIYAPRLAEEHKFGYVPRLAEEHKFVCVPRFWAEEHKVAYVPRFWAEERKVGYVPQFWPRNISSHMFLGFGLRNISLDTLLGWPRNISSYVPWFHIAEEHNLYSSAPMSVQSYVRQDIFLSYAPRLSKEHKLCSSGINICSSVFVQGTFFCFL